MEKVLGWLALGGVVLFTIWVLGVDHSRSMEQCERTMSRDTCLYSLR